MKPARDHHVGIGSGFGVSDAEIRAAAYLGTNRKIAQYLGVREARVGQVMGRVRPPIARKEDLREAQKGQLDPAFARRIAKDSSDALLRRLLLYGLDHDGLPGLTAAQFLSRCREAGLRVGRP